MIGKDACVVASNDSADITAPQDRFKYIDDLEMSELIILTGILEEYDFWSHVPSDVGVDQQFLPPQETRSQVYLNYVNNWTQDNLMEINSSKSNYLIFSGSQEDFATRLWREDRQKVRQQDTWCLDLGGCWGLVNKHIGDLQESLRKNCIAEQTQIFRIKIED